MSFSFALSALGVAALVALFKVTLVLTAGLGLTALMRRQSAAARHLVWLVALIATLILPLWSAWSPLPLRVLPPPAARPAIATTDRVAAQTPTVTHVEPAPSAAPVVPAVPPKPRVGLGALLLALWSLGAVVLLARLAAGAWLVRRVVRGARVLEQPDWTRPFYEVADRLGLDAEPRLVESREVRMPFATGFLRAVIVLPAESAAWNAERRCAVLIHELAHVKRRDLVGHVVSRIACALYWFHPLVWTAARRLRAESERACDDLALVLGTRAGDYAEHLLEIVTAVRDERMPAVALAMAKPNEFEGRMLAILDSRRRRTGPGRVQSAWLVGALAGFALLVGGLSPAPRAMVAPPEARKDDPAGRMAMTSDEADRMASDTQQIAVDQATPAKPKPAKSKPAPEAPAKSTAEETPYPDTDSDAQHEANDVQRAQILAKSLRTDSEVEVRRVAAWGLAQYADHEVAAKALAEALAQEQNEGVREMATWSLANSRTPASIAAINGALRDKSAKVRATAVWVAGSIASPSFIDALVSCLGDANPDVREVAAWSIGSCSPKVAPPALVRALGDANRDVRLSAAWALHVIGDAGAADEIEAAFRREKDVEVQRGLIRALGSMGDRAVPTLTRLVDSADPEIRTIAITALAGGHVMGPWPWPRPEPRPFP
jgi:beta-lactamase regulating signal transducer with metallopeptidase domain/HEAT repeat protein